MEILQTPEGREIFSAPMSVIIVLLLVILHLHLYYFLIRYIAIVRN